MKLILSVLDVLDGLLNGFFKFILEFVWFIDQKVLVIVLERFKTLGEFLKNLVHFLTKFVSRRFVSDIDFWKLVLFLFLDYCDIVLGEVDIDVIIIIILIIHIILLFFIRLIICS